MCSPENKCIKTVCMVIAGVLGLIVGLSIYSGGIYFVFCALTAIITVPIYIDKAKTVNGEIGYAILGIFVGIIFGVVMMYASMFIGLILSFIFSVGLKNAISYVVGGTTLLIGIFLYSLFH